MNVVQLFKVAFNHFLSIYLCLFVFIYFVETMKPFFFFQNSFIKKRSKEQHFFEMETFNNTMNVFTAAFDKFDALHYIRILF